MNFHLEPRALSYSVFLTDSLSKIPHLHRHLEIVFLRRGSTVAVSDGKETVVESGDLFIAFPNQIHYYLDRPGPMDVVLLIASPDLCPEFKQDFREFLPVPPVLQWASVNPRINAALENIIESNCVPTRYSNAEIK